VRGTTGSHPTGSRPPSTTLAAFQRPVAFRLGLVDWFSTHMWLGLHCGLRSSLAPAHKAHDAVRSAYRRAPARVVAAMRGLSTRACWQVSLKADQARKREVAAFKDRARIVPRRSLSSSATGSAAGILSRLRQVPWIMRLCGFEGIRCVVDQNDVGTLTSRDGSRDSGEW